MSAPTKHYNKKPFVLQTYQMSDATMHRLRKRQQFPEPDLKVGRIELWSDETLAAYEAHQKANPRKLHGPFLSKQAKADEQTGPAETFTMPVSEHGNYLMAERSVARRETIDECISIVVQLVKALEALRDSE